MSNWTEAMMSKTPVRAREETGMFPGCTGQILKIEMPSPHARWYRGDNLLLTIRFSPENRIHHPWEIVDKVMSEHDIEIVPAKAHEQNASNLLNPPQNLLNPK